MPREIATNRSRRSSFPTAGRDFPFTCWDTLSMASSMALARLFASPASSSTYLCFSGGSCGLTNVGLPGYRLIAIFLPSSGLDPLGYQGRGGRRQGRHRRGRRYREDAQGQLAWMHVHLVELHELV